MRAKEGGFLEALETIKAYHKELETFIGKAEYRLKTPLKEYFDSLALKPSVRLNTILFYSNSYKYNMPFPYLEDITELKFLRCENAGAVTWNELKSLLELKSKHTHNMLEDGFRSNRFSTILNNLKNNRFFG